MCVVKENSREKEKLLVAGVLQDDLVQACSFSSLSLRLCVASWGCVAEKGPKDIYHTQPAWPRVGHGRQRGRGAHMCAVGSASEKFLS